MNIETIEETKRDELIESTEWVAVYKPGLQKAMKELHDSRFRLKAINEIERKARLAVLEIAKAHPEFEGLRDVTLQIEELRYALEGEIWA